MAYILLKTLPLFSLEIFFDLFTVYEAFKEIDNDASLALSFRLFNYRPITYIHQNIYLYTACPKKTLF